MLLDEPSNHLDIPTIVWLEQQLRSFRGAIVLITHDRRFLQAIANRIGELDRGLLSVWDGSYREFLKYRAEQLAAEETAKALFDKKLAQEEVWIRHWYLLMLMSVVEPRHSHQRPATTFVYSQLGI